MPAAVAVPLITSAVGGAVGLYSAKKKADADKAAYNQQVEYQNQVANQDTGGGGGGSSSGGSHSWSKGGTVIDPEVRNTALGGAQSFLADGGLSQEDLHNLRARAATPIRAAYANAEREVNRGTALAGGYSPNRNAALAKMAREQGQGVADAAQNAEAGIAGMRQQGKMAGLSAIASMYGNMPTFNESQSDSWNSSSSGGSSGGSGEILPPVQKPKGFWGNVGSGLMKVGQVALPIALNAYANKGATTTGGVRMPPVVNGLPNGLPGTPMSIPGGNR